MSRPPDRESGRGRSSVRVDRLILFSVVILLLIFVGGYFFVRRAAEFSWSYITNSVLLTALFLTNAVLVLTLFVLLLRNLIKALVERRRGILGSRLRTKLVFSLLLLWLVPSGIIFGAALHLIQRSIDGWFNEPMDRITEVSQQIVDAYYDEARERGGAFAREVARRLHEDGRLRPALREHLHGELGRFLREYDLDLIAVEFRTGPPYVVFDPGLSSARSLEDVPSDRIEAAFAGEPFVWQAGFGEGHLIRAGHPVATGEDAAFDAVVSVGIYVPGNLAGMAEAVTRSNADYRQLRTQKRLIKRIYELVFALITLVVLFSVTWIGLYLARGITEPIRSLAEGTREISSGNLDYRVDVQAGDELGILVESFNRMTSDLKEGKVMIERRNLELSESNRQLRERRRYIETLLQNIGTGVVSLDTAGRITTINRAAGRLLALDPARDSVGKELASLLSEEARRAIEPLVAEITADGLQDAARAAEVPVAGRTLSLALSATPLRGDGGEALGTILVIEDLTELMRAQKIAAWREVARRLAHEIKNPLTPIQLSAQRIRKKYAERSADLDETVEEGTAAIIGEVAGLKNLVDEFTRFARLPAPNPVPTDMEAFVSSALAIYDPRNPRIHIVPHCDPGLPQVLLDREQMKRVLVNLLDNAVEAMGGEGTVTISARSSSSSGTIRLEVADDGPGIRPEDRDRLFLPYFSTKRRGTGLGLAIVHRIVTDHMGRIRVEDNQPQGARFVIDLPAVAA
jgi:two-component system nitrogen regulation sensor histidine kinase NtrY